MAQVIIDLDAAVPETIGVRCRGDVYDIPGDIAIPDLIALERAVAALEDPDAEGSNTDRMQALYERVLDIFRIHDPELENLPLGPKQLGALIIGIYTTTATEDAGSEDGDRPPKGGTRSTKKPRRKRSASSRS